MIKRCALIGALGVLLLLAGCGGSSRGCPSCNRLSEQNKGLQRQIVEKDKLIDDLRNQRGHLVIATWVAVLSAFGLLTVGIAIGVRIRYDIIALKDDERTDEAE